MIRLFVPLALLVAPSLAWADGDTDTDTETTDSQTPTDGTDSGKVEDEGGCKCASTLTNPTSLVSLGLGVALLAGIRRKRA